MRKYMSRKNPFKGAIILTFAAALAVGLYFVLGPILKKKRLQPIAPPSFTEAWGAMKFTKSISAILRQDAPQKTR
jgi:hypothetical protein